MLKKSILKNLIGGLSTFAILQAIRLMAERSKTVETILVKGFDVVEEKIEDLKVQVLPEEVRNEAAL